MRWLLVSLVIGAVTAAGFVVGLSSASVRSPRRVAARPGPSSAEIVRARPLRGDLLLAGPVLLDDRYAVWAESGRHRLLLRSLDAFGQTRTIFSTSRAPGVSRHAPWPFTVSTLAAGEGRVAFVERVQSCSSSPPRDPSCPAYSHPPFPWESSTLFAGRPGHIRALRRAGRCTQPREPAATAVSNAGIVVEEEQDICPGPRTTARVVLRSFSGRLIRDLTPSTGCVDCIVTLHAAGSWAAFVREATNAGNPDQVTVIRASTGGIGARVTRPTIGDVTVDSSGNFALLTPGQRAPCQAGRGPEFGQVTVGKVGRPGLAVLSRRADWNLSAATPGIAIAGRQVAFFRPTGRCQRGVQVVVGSPSGAVTPAPDVGPARSANGVAPAPLAFDGHLLATRRGDTIQLTAAGCPGPSVPIPAHEPAYSSRPTELVSGLYIQGGPLPPPPCKPEPRGPYAGTIKVTNPGTGAVVARQSVRARHLAHIRLAAGTYSVTGHFSHGITPPAVKVRVRAGKRVRQDVFEDVP